MIEDFAVGDRVSHDSHGLGRVIGVYAAGVSVDFGDQTVHVRSPFTGMSTL